MLFLKKCVFVIIIHAEREKKMASVNKVLILGNIGQNPELKTTSGGKSVTTMNIATSHKWKDDRGEIKEATEWHRVIVWGKPAENCAKYLKKGSSCFVEGRLSTRSFEKDGVKKFVTEIVAESVKFLSSEKKPQEEPKHPAHYEPFEAREIIYVPHEEINLGF